MLYICLLYSYGELVDYARTKRNQTYICKPTTGCQGRGIFVTKNVKEIKPHDKMVCQVYISRVSPFLTKVLYIKYLYFLNIKFTGNTNICFFNCCLYIVFISAISCGWFQIWLEDLCINNIMWSLKNICL